MEEHSSITEEVVQKFLDDKKAEWENMDMMDLIREIDAYGELYVDDDALVKTICWGEESAIYGVTQDMIEWTQKNWLVSIESELYDILEEILYDAGITLDLDVGELYLSIEKSANDLMGYLYKDEYTGADVEDIEKQTTEWYPASEFEDSWPGISLLYGMCARPVEEDGDVDASDEYIYGIEDSVPYLNSGVSKITRL